MDAEMHLILAAATTWEEAVAEPTEEYTGAAEDAVVDAEAVAVRTTGVLEVRCAPTAKEDLVPRLPAPDATLAAALVSPSLVLLAQLSTTPAANAAKRRLLPESASGHACGPAAVLVLHPSLNLSP